MDRNETEHLKWKSELAITDRNKYRFYSQYYERRFSRCPMDGYNYLEKLMEHAKPSTGYVMLAYLLSQTPHNVVITTNFDHLIEDAVNYYAQTIPLVIGHEALAHYISTSIVRPTIIKIHRDLLLDPKNSASEVEKLHENWKDALEKVFSNYHPIFIGYAGNDNSLMEFLTENSHKFLNGEWCFPYWLSYKTTALDDRIKTLLVNSNGYYVIHDGFDEVLYLIGAALNYKMPTKEEFLKDAEKRFQDLSNSIDEFTDKLSKESFSGQNTAAAENAVTQLELSQAARQITSQADLQRLYINAILLHRNQKYDEALNEKQKLTKLDPNNGRYHNSLGVTLHEMKRYEEALLEKQRAIELDPDNAQYHYSLGVTLHEMKRYEEALAESKKAIELDPDNAQYHYSLGVTLHEMKRYEEALLEKQRAIELEPDSVKYLNSLKYTKKAMDNVRKPST